VAIKGEDMQNTNDEVTIKKISALLIAILMLVSLAAVYLFPWFVPIIWPMPENTVLPYYGILIAVEMAPASFVLKTNAMASARKTSNTEV
jgi:hypothetical protein